LPSPQAIYVPGIIKDAKLSASLNAMRVANLSELQNEIETVVMDVVEEDQDVQLQRASSDLLADFESSLQPFLWKTLENGKLKIRRKVRARETDRLVALVCQ
jgi:hypothetical protein